MSPTLMPGNSTMPMRALQFANLPLARLRTISCLSELIETTVAVAVSVSTIVDAPNDGASLGAPGLTRVTTGGAVGLGLEHELKTIEAVDAKTMVASVREVLIFKLLVMTSVVVGRPH